ncbi:hypothetical protein MMC19_005215 [Ptychographa xylographoides]|nr:hypothetical protein [Ptychographa xylographoides]
MTDSFLSHTTQSAPTADSLAHPALYVTEASRLDTILNSANAEEEEDYTIKCICGFREDDGKTVYCEECGTWQHMDCYYHKEREPGPDDVHNCEECGPVKKTPHQKKHATERQRKRREDLSIVERKLKKPPGKSHKKKVKPSDTSASHTNGWLYDNNDSAALHNGAAAISRDQPPAKRSKTSHRPSHSMHTQTVPLNASAHSNKRSTSASHTTQSPSKTPSNHTPNGYHSEPYSADFIHLYDDDPGDYPLAANSFNNIRLAHDMADWSHDREALEGAANGKTHQDIFMRCQEPLNTMPLPPLQKEIKSDNTVDYDGIHPSWTYLTISSDTPAGSIVGELRGKIGHMQDYVQEPKNRWEYLRHPLPFVFFHPYLPIYIDTRHEGNICRYLRRSCSPNLTMKTLLENGSEYHFCFVATQDLEVGTELTVPWTPDAHVRTYFQQKNDVIKQEGAGDTDESYVADWVAKVLADFGGCACNSPIECSMAKYDRRNSMFSGDTAIHMSNGKPKKTKKAARHLSSQSTGRATNSRSGSEALKHQEDDENDDSRSTSTSTRSKPNSRDMTPLNNLPGDKSVATGVELSDREKRKIADAEKKFEQLEHERQQAVPRKKKRVSANSALNTPTVASSSLCFPIAGSPNGVDNCDQKDGQLSGNALSQPSTPAITPKPKYVDTGTLRAHSNSPTSRSPLGMPFNSFKSSSYTTVPSMPSPLSRSNYVDSSMQTETETEDGLIPLRQPFVSLTRRFLIRCHKGRVRLAEAKQAGLVIQPVQDQNDCSMHTQDTVGMTSDRHDSEGDIVMQDEEAITVPLLQSDEPVEKPRPPDESIIASQDSAESNVLALKPTPPLPLWTSPQPPERKEHINGFRAADLRVQLPPQQIFSAGPVTPGIITSANSVTGAVAQSPLSQTPSSFPPPLFSLSSSSTMVAPSPVKKKLSLGDYMNRNRNHKADTPTTATNPNPPPSLLSFASATGSSPILTTTMLKPPDNIAEEAMDLPMDGSTLLETPKAGSSDPMVP